MRCAKAQIIWEIVPTKENIALEEIINSGWDGFERELMVLDKAEKKEDKLAKMKEVIKRARKELLKI